MKRTLSLAACSALLLTTVSVASPMKIRTHGGNSQHVIMCPDCAEKLTCAKVGDYTIGFEADLDNPKTGAARVGIHLKDKAGKPVNDAQVVATLTMPKHGHGKKPLTLLNMGHGRYDATTQLGMSGGWVALVEVTTAGGDTVKQAFSFSK